MHILINHKKKGERTMSYIVKQPMAGGRIHIHLAENHHDPEKQGARQTRTYLGVLDPVNNELVLGRGLGKPNSEVLALLAAKGIHYTGKRSAGPGRKRTRPVRGVAPLIAQSTVEEIGCLRSLLHLAGSCGLTKSLKVGFGEKIGNRILALAVYQACEGDAMYLGGPWAEEAGLGKGFSSSSISRLCFKLGKDGSGRDKFFKAWIEACGKPRALIHDTTSISTYSSNLEDAEWGYNRDEEKMEQINLALVVSRNSRLPLWFRTVPGSIPDVSTLKLTCKTLKAFGLKNFSCSLDRGYFSRTNLLDMLEAGIDFIIGVPLSVNQAKTIIKANRQGLKVAKRSFLYKGSRLRHTACNYSLEGKNGKIVDLSGHLYFDPERHELSAARLESVVLGLEHKASTNRFSTCGDAQTWRADNGAWFARFLSVKLVDDKWKIVRKSNVISKVVNNYGMTLVVTTDRDRCREDVLDDYRCRDIAEKIIDIAKNDSGADRLRTGKSNNAQGRLFIAFISIILRCLVEDGLRKAGLLKRYSVDETLALLRKVKRIRLPDGSRTICEIPKKTRIVAEALMVEF